MTEVAAPTVVDYLTLGAAVIAASGTILSWWHERAKQNERVDAALEWVFGHDYFGEPDFYPTVIVHNRSADSIAISDVSLSWGWAKRRRIKYTALDYDDPADLAFPYVVASGAFWQKRISNGNFGATLARGKWARVAWLVRRASLWIRVETMRGTVSHIGAMRMTNSNDMPEWLKDEGEE